MERFIQIPEVSGFPGVQIPEVLLYQVKISKLKSISFSVFVFSLQNYWSSLNIDMVLLWDFTVFGFLRICYLGLLIHVLYDVVFLQCWSIIWIMCVQNFHYNTEWQKTLCFLYKLAWFIFLFTYKVRKHDCVKMNKRCLSLKTNTRHYCTELCWRLMSYILLVVIRSSYMYLSHWFCFRFKVLINLLHEIYLCIHYACTKQINQF